MTSLMAQNPGIQGFGVLHAVQVLIFEENEVLFSGVENLFDGIAKRTKLRQIRRHH